MNAANTMAQSWRLGRQIGLAVIVTLVLQGATVLLWAGRAGERISQLETRIESQQDVLERLARLETHMVQTRQSLSRIESQLDNRP
ncbi:hypothetical protein MNBD_ALPHA06-754 [hydrothermal vent metagenome]|uniref:Uncharacterized protein n=1 Tax=hydrothermal vent metagenome TaxID=652676 RepID=A0A3B0S1N2_9ZZZZ